MRQNHTMPLRSIEQYRRLQIGGIGLAGVILLVVLAGILSERNIAPGTSGAAENAAPAGNAKKPSEPLSELGVQPAPAAQAEQAPPATEARPAQPERSETLPEIKPGERVPDLPATATPPAQ